MRLDYVGHATLALRTRDVALLFDPVFGPTHQQGTCAVSPPRRVNLGQLPRFDALVVSHQHLDHLDLATLASLPRDVEVFTAQDPDLVRLVEALGFTRVHALGPWSRVRLGGTTLLAVPSAAPLPELAFVVFDGEACCFHAIDAMLTPHALAVARAQAPPIDLLLAGWQPLLEARLARGLDHAFPFAAYGGLLQRIYELEPAHVVPVAAGYRYLGAGSWQNHAAFPVSRERLLMDLAGGLPTARVHPLDPGDRLTLADGQARVEARGCPWVERDDADPELLAYSPGLVGPAFVDQPPAWAAGLDLASITGEVLDVRLPEVLAAHEPLWSTWRRWGLITQLVVVGGEGEQRRVVDCTGPRPRVVAGRDPRANAGAYITASGLAGLALGRHDWSALLLADGYRSWEHVYRATPAGLARPEGVTAPNFFQLCFPTRAAFLSARERELAGLGVER